jgi:hypothetical protein
MNPAYFLLIRIKKNFFVFILKQEFFIMITQILLSFWLTGNTFIAVKLYNKRHL